MKNNNKRIAIIGGGAAGLSAAISAAEFSKKNNLDTEIIIFEKSNKVGKSLLKTGNGRCNFSNLEANNVDTYKYHNWKFVKEVQDNCKELLNQEKLFSDKQGLISKNFFDYLGIWWTDIEGKLYPRTLQASTVHDCLLSKMQNLNVFQKSESNIKKIKKNKQRYVIEVNNKLQFFDSIIICNGGINSSDIEIENSNILYNNRKYVLGPIETESKIPARLDGVRVKVRLKLIDNDKTVFSEEGEILFRKYGISGIVVFNASRFLNSSKHQTILIDFFSDYTVEDIFSELKKRFNSINAPIKADKLCQGMLPKKLLEVIAIMNPKFKNIRAANLKGLADYLKNFSIIPKQVNTKNVCQVARGGLDVLALNDDLSLKNNPKIFFAGETVDVDGACGGYNLDWAWTSGIYSGINAVRKMYEN